jgi:UDP-N-acetyl-D-mannosaminuronate dehydrogenase
LKPLEQNGTLLNVKPGLVGGHCIGVDPYYLASKKLKKLDIIPK